MNKPNWKNLLPKNISYIVYYCDGFILQKKEFSCIEYATPFIKTLLSNPDFHFIEFRKRIENEIRIDYKTGQASE